LRKRTCRKPQTGHARQKLRQCNIQCDSRKMRAYTNVWAVPKRPMFPGMRAVEIDLQGIAKNAAVEIGERHGEHDHLTLLEMHAAKGLVPCDTAKSGSNTEAT
jgi:hypothetical protein